MSTITHFLEQNTNKVYGTFKDEASLTEVLKRRLTKKEYKLLQAIVSKEERSGVATKLGFDVSEFDAFEKKLIKKLNQSKIKEEILVEEGVATL